jgi:hypothetical protein
MPLWPNVGRVHYGAGTAIRLCHAEAGDQAYGRWCSPAGRADFEAGWKAGRRPGRLRCRPPARSGKDTTWPPGEAGLAIDSAASAITGNAPALRCAACPRGALATPVAATTAATVVTAFYLIHLIASSAPSLGAFLPARDHTPNYRPARHQNGLPRYPGLRSAAPRGFVTPQLTKPQVSAVRPGGTGEMA